MSIVPEIKARADIRDVWSALGGGQLRRGRGQAFWRGGDGYSVSLNPEKGLWHDFVTGEGGDVVALVQTIQQCDFKAALRWLADLIGLGIPELSQRRDNRPDFDNGPADLRWATWWKIAAEALAEQALEELGDAHPDRRGLTVLLSTIRIGDLSLVTEYREWRWRFPVLTHAMARAGQNLDACRQRRLMLWIGGYLDEPPGA
jgi:hypothetical protein